MIRIPISRRCLLIVCFFVSSLLSANLFAPTAGHAYSGEDFLTDLKAKLETTSNIYLEARSTQLRAGSTTGDTPRIGDTASVTLAYAYPRQFLQKIVGASKRRQYVIINNDTMVVSYPHLDYHREQPLERGRLRQLLTEHIPLAGALVGVSEGRVPADSITVRTRENKVYVSVVNSGNDLPFRQITGRFKRDGLVPERITLRGNRVFRLDIVKYVEEERFPLWVEKTLNTLDLKWMKETPA